MRKLFCNMLFLLIIALLSGCGGGGKSGSSAKTVKATIKASALTADMNIAGIDLAISVPLGVAPPLLPDGTVDQAATVVIASSAPKNQTQASATYISATAAAPGQIAIFGIVAAGFKATDEITIHLNVAEGAFPEEKNFALLSFKAFDTNGLKVFDKNAAPGTNLIELSPGLTVTIQ